MSSFNVMDENFDILVASTQKMSTPSQRRGLQEHDPNRLNISNNHPSIAPSAYDVSKPAKHSVMIIDSNNVAKHPLALKPKGKVTFDEIFTNDENAGGYKTASVSPNTVFSPTTPGFPNRKVKAGHTPFKDDKDDEVTIQDSFMEKNFRHHYGLDREFSRDYSAFSGNTASSLSLSSKSGLDSSGDSMKHSNQTMTSPQLDSLLELNYSVAISHAGTHSEDVLSPKRASPENSNLAANHSKTDVYKDSDDEYYSSQNGGNGLSTSFLIKDKDSSAVLELSSSSPIASLSPDIHSKSIASATSSMESTPVTFNNSFSIPTNHSERSEEKSDKQKSGLATLVSINLRDQNVMKTGIRQSSEQAPQVVLPSTSSIFPTQSIGFELHKKSSVNNTPASTNYLVADSPEQIENSWFSRQALPIRLNEFASRKSVPSARNSINQSFELSPVVCSIGSSDKSVNRLSTSMSIKSTNGHTTDVYETELDEAHDNSRSKTNPEIQVKDLHEVTSANVQKSKEFDVDFFQIIRQSYVDGKLTKERYHEMIQLLVQESQYISNKSLIDPVSEIKSNDEKIDQVNSRLSTTRSNSAPRSSLVKQTQLNSVNGIRDDSVDVSAMTQLISKRKQCFDDMALSPNLSPMRVRSSLPLPRESSLPIRLCENTSVPDLSTNMPPFVLRLNNQPAPKINQPMIVETQRMNGNYKKLAAEDLLSGYVADGVSSSESSSYELSSSFFNPQTKRENVSYSQFNRPTTTSQDDHNDFSSLSNDHSASVSSVMGTSRNVKLRDFNRVVGDNMISNATKEGWGFSTKRPNLLGLKQSNGILSSQSTAPVNVKTAVNKDFMNLHTNYRNLDQSLVSEPYLGNNEPSFARKISDRQYNNHDQDARDESTSTDSFPLFAPVMSVPQSPSEPKVSHKSNLVDVCTSPLMMLNDRVDVSVQCSSINLDSNSTDPKSSLHSMIDKNISSMDIPDVKNSTVTPQSIKKNLASMTAFLQECFDGDESNIPMESNGSDDTTGHNEFSMIVKDLQETIKRHNLQVSWNHVSHNPFKDDNSHQNMSSRSPWSTSSEKPSKNQKRNVINHHDDEDNETYEFDSIPSNDRMNISFTKPSTHNDMRHITENDTDIDDAISMTSSINSSSTYTVPSVVNAIHLAYPHNKNNNQMNLKPLSNQISSSIHGSKITSKSSFDVNIVSLGDQSRNKVHSNQSSPRNEMIYDRMESITEQSIRNHQPQFTSSKNNHYDEEFDNESETNDIQSKSFHPDDSDMFSLATTMTFESSSCHSMNATAGQYCGLNNESIHMKKLAITSKRRSKKNIQDSVKEIGLIAKPGEFNSYTLTFTNHKDYKRVLYPATILTRYDPMNSNQQHNGRIDTTGYQLELLPEYQAFQVSPHMIEIPPNSEGNVYITFSPGAQYEGIYTGVLRIKSNRKSYTILLRGEALYSDELNSTKSNATTNDAVINFNSQSRYTNDTTITTKMSSLHDTLSEEQTIKTSKNTNQGQPSIEMNHTSFDYREDMRSYVSPSTSEIVSTPLKAVEHDDTNTKYERVDAQTSINRSYCGNEQTPNSINSSTFADAIMYLNEMADNMLVKHEKDAKFGLSVKNTSKNNELYDYIIQPESASTNDDAMRSMKLRNDDFDCKCSTDQLLEKKKHLKDILSRCKTASKGINKYKDLLKPTAKVDLVPASDPSNLKQSPESVSIPSESSQSDQMKRRSMSFDGTNASKNKEEKPNEGHQSDRSEHITRLSSKQSGVFFRQESVNIGCIEVGTLSRIKLELCNATEEEVHVMVGDPGLPYILYHNDIRLRPRSYTRLPLRFVPVSVGTFSRELIAQTVDGKHHTRVIVTGSAYENR